MTVPSVAESVQYFNAPAMVQGKKVMKAEKEAVLEDGVNDKWTEENKMGTDSVCAVKNGWLHIKSGTQNRNDVGTNSTTKPSMFVNPTK